MKKNKIFGILIIGLLCLFLYGCSCSEHLVHDYKTMSSFNCVNGGEVELKCSCGESIREKRSPQKHEFDLSNKCSACGVTLSGTSGLVFGDVGGKYMVVDYSGSDKSVVIPYYHEGQVVTGISAGAFRDKGIEEIIFSDNILLAQDDAFYGNDGLRVVRFEGLEEDYSMINFENTYSNPLFAGGKFYVGEKEIDRADALNGQILYPNMLSGVSLNTLVLGNTIKTILNGAFNGCKFNNVFFEGSFDEWNEIEFEGLSANPLNFMSDSGEFRLGGIEFNESMLLNIATLNDYVLSGYKGESLSFGEGLEKLSNYSLSNCKNLNTLNLPNSLFSICEGAFYGTNLDKITLKSGVEVIEAGAFSGTASFIDFGGASGLSKFNSNIFRGYLGEKIVVPSQVREIKAYAFNGAATLREIVINGEIERLGTSSFVVEGNINLDRLYLPKTLSYIESGAFDGSVKVNSLYFSGDLEEFMLIQNIGVISQNAGYKSLYIVNELEESSVVNQQGFALSENNQNKIELGSRLTQSSKMANANKVARACIPKTSLMASGDLWQGYKESELGLFGFQGNDENALSDSSGLITTSADVESLSYTKIEGDIVLPSVDYIQDCTFMNLKDLTGITFVSSVQIGARAFMGTNITSIFGFDYITSIGTLAFADCDIRSLEINCEISIWEQAFLNNKNLTSLTINAFYSSVSNDIFENCNIKSVECLYSLLDLVPKDSLREIVIFGGNQGSSIRDELSGCESLESVELINIDTIGINAFSGCINLRTIDLSGVRFIGSNAFLDCYNLYCVKLGESLEQGGIGSNAFLNCYKLIEVVNNSSVDLTTNNLGNICDYALNIYKEGEGESRLVIDIESGLVFFDGDNELLLVGSNTNLEGELVLENTYFDSTFEMLDYAFYGSNIESVLIYGGGVVSKHAFQNCKNLKSVSIFGGVDSIEYQAFYELESLTSVVLQGVHEIKTQAFYRCKNLSELVLSKDIVNIESNTFTSCFSLLEVKFMGSMSEYSQINILDNYIIDCIVYYDYVLD